MEFNSSLKQFLTKYDGGIYKFVNHIKYYWYTRVIRESSTNYNHIISFTGTSVSINANSVYQKTLEELQTTQAYVESLNEEQLSEMIAKLEQKDIKLSIQEHEYTKKI